MSFHFGTLTLALEFVLSLEKIGLFPLLEHSHQPLPRKQVLSKSNVRLNFQFPATECLNTVLQIREARGLREGRQMGNF